MTKKMYVYMCIYVVCVHTLTTFVRLQSKVLVDLRESCLKGKFMSHATGLPKMDRNGSGKSSDKMYPFGEGKLLLVFLPQVTYVAYSMMATSRMEKTRSEEGTYARVLEGNDNICEQAVAWPVLQQCRLTGSGSHV